MSHRTAFDAHRKELADKYYLVGDNVLVEELPKAEVKTKSGIVLAAGGTKAIDGIELGQLMMVRVLDVGPGFYDEETGEDVPLEVQIGDICAVSRMSIQFFSSFGPLVSSKGQQIGRIRESEIWLRYKGQEAWDKACQVLEQYRTGTGE